MTRPEPTIYGNCDSWNFIVGKKSKTVSPHKALGLTLQANHRQFIHSLSTESCQKQQNNMWVSCGELGGKSWESRMVVNQRFIISI
jgi:hypothetical protein